MSEHRQRGGRWLTNWDPEDEEFWRSTGRRTARRNLWLTVASEHIGFSVWSIWSVLVLFVSDGTAGFGSGQKFLIVVVPTLVGAVLRLPYGFAVTRFGGRNWTVFSTMLLLVPVVGALYVVRRPDTPLWAVLIVAALAGAGGGSFASAMTNIIVFFPGRHQGWALGVTAGGGNLGVAVVQLLGLFVLVVHGGTHPAYVVAVYLPVIAVVGLLALRGMDNVAAIRSAPGAQREALTRPHTWWICLLYVGTFGSFIGYSFAFGLVLQSQFGATPVQAASYTFLGPLLGSVARPVGGRLADRWGGARVTLWSFVGLAAGTCVLLVASVTGSFTLFVGGFTVLFVLSGLGNGSAYKMIPAVFGDEAGRAITAGGDARAAFARARRLSGAVIALAGAVGALGGVGVNLAFRAAYGGHEHTGTPAFCAFLVYYVLCIALVRAVYLRRAPHGRGTAGHHPSVKEGHVH